MWDWIFWIIMGLGVIWFIYDELPELIYRIKNTSKYGDDDPSGNDNINRSFHDYM